MIIFLIKYYINTKNLKFLKIKKTLTLFGKKSKLVYHSHCFTFPHPFLTFFSLLFIYFSSSSINFYLISFALGSLFSFIFSAYFSWNFASCLSFGAHSIFSFSSFSCINYYKTLLFSLSIFSFLLMFAYFASL